MTKLWLSPYQLRLKQTGELRHGYLLKLQTLEFKEGYADIFPWQEFGDPILEDIPQMLRFVKGSPMERSGLQLNAVGSVLLKHSLNHALEDGRARAHKQQLCSGQSLKNHLLVTDIFNFGLDQYQAAVEQGYTRLKLKVARRPVEELKKLEKICQWLGDSVLLRLDCNSMGGSDFLSALTELESFIEFIEDPATSAPSWKKSSRYAYDQPPFPYDRVKTDWQVLKPAKQNLTDIEGEKIIFTSYMDHPVGIMHGMRVALSFGQQEFDYGLMSQHIYESNTFSDLMNSDGAQLMGQEDYGIGFTELLENQQWVSL